MLITVVWKWPSNFWARLYFLGKHYTSRSLGKTKCRHRRSQVPPRDHAGPSCQVFPPDNINLKHTSLRFSSSYFFSFYIYIYIFYFFICLSLLYSCFCPRSCCGPIAPADFSRRSGRINQSRTGLRDRDGWGWVGGGDGGKKKCCGYCD